MMPSTDTTRSLTATLSLALDEADHASEPDAKGDTPGWRNGTLTITLGDETASFVAGGGWLLTSAAARDMNASRGLQPDDHPEMRWPGAVSAGAFSAYEGDDAGDLAGAAAFLGLEEDAAEDLVRELSGEAARADDGHASRDVALDGISALRTSLERADAPAAVRFAQLLCAAGCSFEGRADDGDAEELNGDGESLWVTSTHTLLADGHEVATWTRCSVGSYGGTGGPGTRADTWTVEEDTEGGDVLPDAVKAVLAVLEIEDEIPDVPEPALASDTYAEDPEGLYAVRWDSVGDDDGRIVARYATAEAAAAVADERNRILAAQQPGSLLCGHSVAVWADGAWNALEED